MTSSGSITGGLDGRCNIHSDVFRPPRIPASFPQDLNIARKRSRTNSAATNANVFTPQCHKISQGSWMTDISLRTNSPPPLANTRYELAGGFDTPTWAAAGSYEQDYISRGPSSRTTWETRAVSSSAPDVDDHDVQGPLAREGNGRPRISPSTHTYEQRQAEAGWGKFVLNLVGGVAGSVWSFCRENAFRGFSAGTGRGYTFARPTHLHANSSPLGSSTPVPGRWVSDNFAGYFDQDMSPVRPAKRLQTDSGTGWVVVDHELDTRPASPRLSDRKMSSGIAPRGSPTIRQSASRATSRRCLVPVSRRASSQVSYTGSPQLQSSLHPAAGLSSYDRRTSVASTRSASAYQPRNSIGGSPLSPEAQRFLHRKEKQDRVADKSMRKMSRQVEDLIRQGQAALSTKVEIEDDGADLTDEGYEEGDGDEWIDAGYL